MDRLDAMQAFVAVADLQGFAPAARKLGLSPSAVTRLIAALEERLGARLLQRTTRQVALTDVGARYLERVRRILGDVEEAEAAAEGERSRPSGRLVVSAPVGFGRLHVSPVMSAYLKRYPDVSAELLVSDQIVNLVEDAIDLAVRIGHLGDSTLVARHVGEMRRIVVASRGYLKTRGEPKTPQAVASHATIQFGAAAGEHGRVRVVHDVGVVQHRAAGDSPPGAGVALLLMGIEELLEPFPVPTLVGRDPNASIVVDEIDRYHRAGE